MILMSVTVSAHDWHASPYDNDRAWIHHHHHYYYDDERRFPFAWHEHFESMRYHHHLDRVYDHEWGDRFPGLHAYRWSDHEGFWHHGHHVKDAIFFYDEDNQLVSVGYMDDGVFINFREDHESYENHDSFFFSWFHR